MTDITAIKRALEGRAKAAAEHLLPNGRREGREWCAGSVAGEPGKSLKVAVSGAKSGTWADFATGESGDLIDLWRSVKGRDLPDALDDIRGWLGLERPRFERHEKSYRRPEQPKGSAPKSAVLDYLTGGRGLSAVTIKAYRVGEDGRTMVLQSFLPDGTLAAVKHLGIDRDPKGKKIIRVEPGCEPVLFGWQAIDRNARAVTITEGEIDAMTAAGYGWPALSVPFGGGGKGKQQWIESEFERLSRFEVIYLALDMDQEGDAAVAEIANRLGRHRCRRVALPHKDLNDCLRHMVSANDICAAFEAASTLDPAELRRAGEFTDSVVSLFWPSDDVEPGYRLPFGKIGGKLLFRPGEMSIWTGPSGSGKSQLLSHAMVAMGAQGARACIASLEMAPRQLLRRMVKQSGNIDRPPEPYIREIMGWMNEWLWVLAVVGKSGAEAILEVFEYARCRYGCDVFVIDSLMRLGIGSEDYEGQEKAVYGLVTWATERGVHLHLVAHARKADRAATGVPELEDIKGASEIGANAFNIVAVWRNRKLEDEIKKNVDAAERGDETAKVKLAELEEKPAVILNIAKQRNGDWEGKCGLWFSQETYQYRSHEDARHGRSYLPRGIAGNPCDAAAVEWEGDL